MAVTDMRRRLKQRVDRLSEARLRVADDFLAYLEERESEEATAELLAIPGFRGALKQAEADIARGHVTPVRDLRRRS
jgi:hypothetical protein